MKILPAIKTFVEIVGTLCGVVLFADGYMRLYHDAIEHGLLSMAFGIVLVLFIHLLRNKLKANHP